MMCRFPSGTVSNPFLSICFDKKIKLFFSHGINLDLDLDLDSNVAGLFSI